MDAKRLLIGSVAGAVVANLYGFLVYDMALGSFFEGQATAAGAAVMRDQPVWWAVVLGSLLIAAMVTLVVDWSGSSSMGDGFKTGAIFGLLVFGGIDFLFVGFTDMTSMTGTISDIVVGSVQTGLVGLVIALALGKTAAEPAAAA
jgi:hypothetical protein